ncbi:MAG: hypothetical protein K2K54_10735 [Lachnospiraceae bacterium]|nr:hypothetical protein [Lachnospiraceae bacterium]
MKRKLKKFLPLYYIVTFSLSIASGCNATKVPYYAGLLQTAEIDIGINPQSDNIDWRFKIENGKIYKRLYNYSTETWIGDWILVS